MHLSYLIEVNVFYPNILSNVTLEELLKLWSGTLLDISAIHLHQILGTLSNQRYIREVEEPDVLPPIQRILGDVFHQAIFRARHVRFFSWPACYAVI